MLGFLEEPQDATALLRHRFRSKSGGRPVGSKLSCRSASHSYCHSAVSALWGRKWSLASEFQQTLSCQDYASLQRLGWVSSSARCSLPCVLPAGLAKPLGPAGVVSAAVQHHQVAIAVPVAGRCWALLPDMPANSTAFEPQDFPHLTAHC